MITVRTLVLSLVTLVAFIVLAPTLRAYVTQSEQDRRVTADVARTQAEVAELEAQLARWDDPSYVQAQARERLSFVMPGEVPYLVIDPGSVETADGAAVEAKGLQAAEAPGPEVPWYLTVWESIEAAGEPLPAPTAEAPAVAPTGAAAQP
jgi:cell division protein FtsB